MAQKTRSEYAALNIVSGLGGYVISMVLTTVCRMIFTRVFVADYLGVTGLFNNVIGMLSLAELGIGSAIVYALYEPIAKNDTKKITTLVRFYGKCYRVIGVVVFAIGLLLLPFMDLIIKEKPAISESYYYIYIILLFNTASTYFFSYRSSLLVAAQKNYLLTLFSNIMAVVQNVVQIVVIICLKNYIAYLLVSAFTVFINNIFSYWLTQKHYPYISNKESPPLDKAEKRSLLRNVYSLTVNRIGGILVNSTDNIIITYLSNLASVGLLSNYTLFSGNISSVLRIVFNSLVAGVGNHNVLESKEKKLSMFYSINLANFWLYGWAAIGICVVSTDFVRLLFGENYVLPSEIPFIVAVNFYMMGMQSVVSTYFSTNGLFSHCRYLVLLTAGINIVASLILGKYLGLFGVLLATAISRVFTNTWYNPYAVFKYVFELPFRVYVKRYIGYLVILVATGAVCWLLCSLVNASLVVNTVIRFLICCIIPNAVFFCLFRKSEEFKTLTGFVKVITDRIMAKIKVKFNHK